MMEKRGAIDVELTPETDKIEKDLDEDKKIQRLDNDITKKFSNKVEVKSLHKAAKIKVGSAAKRIQNMLQRRIKK